MESYKVYGFVYRRVSFTLVGVIKKKQMTLPSLLLLLCSPIVTFYPKGGGRSGSGKESSLVGVAKIKTLQCTYMYVFEKEMENLYLPSYDITDLGTKK